MCREGICLDSLDRQILLELQENARISSAQLARKIGLSTSATAERIAKLEREGIIKGYTVELDNNRIGAEIAAFILVPVGNMPIDEMGILIAGIPQVMECHKITGNSCYMVKVRASSMAELERIIDAINHAAPNTHSFIVLSTIKETGKTPLNTEGE